MLPHDFLRREPLSELLELLRRHAADGRHVDDVEVQVAARGRRRQRPQPRHARHARPHLRTNK